ncbi:hypothetical protein L6R52_27725 [Myxococcota bacterium]|nr:hypothetical protein [Myxococcota bacterium]
MSLSKDRIEEFRKKLRQGRPVRVVDGRVVLTEDEREAASKPPGAEGTSAPAATSAAQGVQVKPHTWGQPRRVWPEDVR